MGYPGYLGYLGKFGYSPDGPWVDTVARSALIRSARAAVGLAAWGAGGPSRWAAAPLPSRERVDMEQDYREWLRRELAKHADQPRPHTCHDCASAKAELLFLGELVDDSTPVVTERAA